MTCGVYKIKNLVNGKMYIGQSVDVERRWKEHIYNSRYEYRNNHLYSAIRKYGHDNFLFEVVVECDEHMLDEFEIGIIKLYDTTNPKKGYNKTFGGEGGKKTEETKIKLSNANKGKTRSEETKIKLSNANKGKSHSDEHKMKISKQHIYQGNIYNGRQELADFLGITYTNLTNRIYKKTIDVTILPKNTKK